MIQVLTKYLKTLPSALAFHAPQRQISPLFCCLSPFLHRETTQLWLSRDLMSLKFEKDDFIVIIIEFGFETCYASSLNSVLWLYFFFLN